MDRRRLLRSAAAFSTLTLAGLSVSAGSGWERVKVRGFESKITGFTNGLWPEAGTTDGECRAPTTPTYAKLRRSSRGIRARMSVDNLEQGAYTAWWVVFGSPPEENAGWPVKVFWADNAMVGADGKATFKARLRVGESRAGFSQSPNDALMATLATVEHPERQQTLDGYVPPTFTADDVNREIWLINKWHGELSDDPAVAYSQLNEVQGACQRYSLDDENVRPSVLGAMGQVLCYDPHIAIFPPVGGEAEGPSFLPSCTND